MAGILLALGDAGFVLNFLKRVAPLLGFIRFPVKFIVLTVFSLAMLAGAGMAWLQTQPKMTAGGSLFRPALWIALIVVALLMVASWFPFPSDVWGAIWPNALGRLAFLWAGLALLALFLKTQSPLTRALVAFAFLLCLGLDICTHTPPQNPTVPPQAYGGYPPLMTRVPRLGESRAMLSPEAEAIMDNLVNPDLLQLYLGQRAELFSDCNLLNRIPRVGGFMTLHLA